MATNPAFIIYVLVFAAIVVLVQSLAEFFFVAGDKNRRVNRRLTMLDSGMSNEQVYSALIRKSGSPVTGDAGLSRLYSRFEIYCQQAGLGFSPLRLLAYAGALTLALWLVGLTVVSLRGGGSIVANAASLIGAAGLAGFSVWTWVRWRRNSRLKQLEAQLPPALDVVTRAIQAGHPVVSAVKLAAEEMGDPIGTEFGLIVDETTYGSEFKDALFNFARRTGSQDAYYFAVAVSIQAETGGNLNEILEGLTKIMRARAALTGKVKALASEGMASAYILSALPVLMVFFVMFTNPHTYLDKFGDPVFWPIVGVILVLYLIGWAIIRRIMHFKY